MGVSPDSVAYLDAARSLRQGDGLIHSTDIQFLSAAMHEHAPSPLVWFAPFYPVVLAAISISPLSLVEGARVLNAVLFAGSVALVGLLALRMMRSRVGALMAASAFALAPVGLDLNARVLSEPLFILLAYVAIALVAYYLSAERPIYFWGAVLATALALLTRYAGAPLLGATALPLLLYSRGAWMTRLSRAAAFVGLSVLPFVAWLVRNWHLTGTATGRQLAWHPISPDQLATGISEATLLIVPRDAPTVVRGLLALAIVIAVVAAGTRVSREGLMRGFNLYLLTSLVLYIALSLIFLVVSISALDAMTSLGSRFLFPMYPGVVLIASWVLVAAFRASSNGVVRIALTAGIVVFLCGNAVGLALQGKRISYDGNGLSGRVGSQSPAIARIRTLPQSTIIYSDRPEFIYFMTGRTARSVPAGVNPMSLQPNHSLANDLRELRGHLTPSDVLVLFADDLMSPPNDRPQLEKELGLVLASRTTDAAFYRTRAAP